MECVQYQSEERRAWVLLNLHWSLILSKLYYEFIVLSNVGCGADKTCCHELPLISESMAMDSLKLHYFMLLCNGGIKNGFNIYLYQVRVITVFTVFRLLTDFVCLYNYEFWLSLCKIVRSSVILLLPLFLRNISSFISDFSGFLIEDDKNISSHMSYITLMIVHKELYHM